MKLRDLQPRFNGRFLVFDCPCGKCGGRIRVALAPQQDSQGQAWNYTGEFPDSLSLTPSVNAGCWHGYITNGEVRPA